MSVDIKLNPKIIESKLYGEEGFNSREAYLQKLKNHPRIEEITYLVKTAEKSRINRIKAGVPIISAIFPGLLKGWWGFATMDELNMFGLDPDAVVGSSIGAYIGIVQSSLTPISEVQKAHQEYDASVIFGKTYKELGFFDPKKAINLLEKNFGEDRDLQDWPVPLFPIATNRHTLSSKMFTSGLTYPRIAASMALSPLYPPQEIEGEEYIDGGYTVPAPVKYARDLAGQNGFVVSIDIYSSKLENGHALNRHVPKWKEILLNFSPNTMELSLKNPYFLLKSLLLPHKVVMSEFLHYFGAVQQSLIDAELALHPPDLHICLRDILNGATAIPLNVESFKKKDTWIEDGRQAIEKYGIDALIDFRTQLDKRVLNTLALKVDKP